MMLQILVGCALIVITSCVHALGMTIGLRSITASNRKKRLANASLLFRSLTISAFILILFFATLVEAGIWALTFTKLGAIPDFLEAFYFSTVTYTTLGYGDIVLDRKWRILSSFEAANGLIMFGWTTALVFESIHQFSKALSDFKTLSHT